MFDQLTNNRVIWTPYIAERVNECAPRGLSSQCLRNSVFWLMQRHLVHDVYVEAYSVHQVMRQFRLQQAFPVAWGSYCRRTSTRKFNLNIIFFPCCIHTNMFDVLLSVGTVGRVSQVTHTGLNAWRLSGCGPGGCPIRPRDVRQLHRVVQHLDESSLRPGRGRPTVTRHRHDRHIPTQPDSTFHCTVCTEQSIMFLYFSCFWVISCLHP